MYCRSDLEWVFWFYGPDGRFWVEICAVRGTPPRVVHPYLTWPSARSENFLLPPPFLWYLT
jgi:hypothetical protein